MLENLAAKTDKPLNTQLVKNLPSAFDLFDSNVLDKKKPVIFLDFDGTLAPIVNNPDDAKLDEEMSRTLDLLMEKTYCAVLTGRDRVDIEKRVAFDKIIYAGSHGYDIKGPGLEWTFEQGVSCLPALDEAQKELSKELAHIDGVAIERKRFAIAVHYRGVAEANTKEVLDKVYAIINSHPKLKPGPGKKVLELKPNIEWHKGRALSWLMDKLNLSSDKYIPVFIGDDLTDEDGFAVIRDSGIGIIVGDHDFQSLATYSLKDPTEVRKFLQKLTENIK